MIVRITCQVVPFGSRLFSFGEVCSCQLTTCCPCDTETLSFGLPLSGAGPWRSNTEVLVVFEKDPTLRP